LVNSGVNIRKKKKKEEAKDGVIDGAISEVRRERRVESLRRGDEERDWLRSGESREV
jgi:hypothetical protein